MSDERKDDGGPAFPGDYDVVLVDLNDKHPPQKIAARQSGMSLRDYFAAQCQADDRLVKVIRAMDDVALELFALHPECEREEHIVDVDLTCWAALPSEVAKVRRRLELEAHAIARVRYMQADAMLAARKAGER